MADPSGIGFSAKKPSAPTRKKPQDGQIISSMLSASIWASEKLDTKARRSRLSLGYNKLFYRKEEERCIEHLKTEMEEVSSLLKIDCSLAKKTEKRGPSMKVIICNKGLQNEAELTASKLCKSRLETGSNDLWQGRRFLKECIRECIKNATALDMSVGGKSWRLGTHQDNFDGLKVDARIMVLDNVQTKEKLVIEENTLAMGFIKISIDDITEHSILLYTQGFQVDDVSGSDMALAVALFNNKSQITDFAPDKVYQAHLSKSVVNSSVLNACTVHRIAGHSQALQRSTRTLAEMHILPDVTCNWFYLYKLSWDEGYREERGTGYALGLNYNCFAGIPSLVHSMGSSMQLSSGRMSPGFLKPMQDEVCKAPSFTYNGMPVSQFCRTPKAS